MTPESVVFPGGGGSPSRLVASGDSGVIAYEVLPLLPVNCGARPFAPTREPSRAIEVLSERAPTRGAHPEGRRKFKAKPVST